MKSKWELACLVRRAAAGEQEAFTTLIGLHKSVMYATALAITRQEEDALDAISDTILILWEKLPTLKKPELFKTWMTKILVNRCRDTLRRKGREIPWAESFPEESREVDYDTPLAVRETLAGLPEGDRLILQLFYFEDLSVGQIAEALSLSAGAVKMRLKRGKARFLEQYEGSVLYERP